MRTALGTADDPMDAKLEAVIPGLNQWHRVHQQSQSKIVDLVTNSEKKVLETVSDLAETVNYQATQESQNRDFLTKLVHDILQVLNQNMDTLASPSNDNSHQHGTRGAGASATSRLVAAANLADGDTEMEPSRGNSEQQELDVESINLYRMRRKHTRLQELYEEWYGLGVFQEPGGGIHGRNQQYGPKWRTKNPNIAKVHYSRTSRTLQAIEKHADIKGMTSVQACADLQKTYDDCKHSVAGFVAWAKTAGLVDNRRSRGRHIARAIAAATTTTVAGDSVATAPNAPTATAFDASGAPKSPSPPIPSPIPSPLLELDISPLL